MTWTFFSGRAKLQSNHHHHQTNTQFLQAGCPSCRPTNSVKARKFCLALFHINCIFIIIYYDLYS